MMVVPPTLKRTCAITCSTVCGWALALGIAIQPAFAQSEASWSDQGLVYLLGPTLDGTTGIGPADTTIDMGVSDVFDALDGAFLGMYRGEGERWGVMLDAVYMDLSGEGESSRGRLSGTLSVEQTSAIASVTYRVSETTRLMVGALYNDVSSDISLTGPLETRMAGFSEDWVDPLIGVLFDKPLSQHWDFVGSIQLGGFGVGSDLVMVIGGAFNYRFNHWSSLSLGYRYLDFDYEDGEGPDRFKFDMKEHGPAIGWRFDF